MAQLFKIPEAIPSRESIADDLKSLLKSNKHDEAIALSKKYKNHLQYYELERIFNKYPLQSEQKCPKCKATIRLVFNSSYEDYRLTSCENCQKIKVEKKLSESLQERLLDHGIAKRFLNAKLTDFSSDIQKASKGEEGLFITGPRGTGKTHLISAIAGNIIKNLPLHISKDHARKIYYFEPRSESYPLIVNVPKLLMQIKGTFNSDYGTDSEESIINRLCRVPILLLDDIGAEKASEWVKQTLYLIIDKRYGDMAKTFVTSNLTLNQISNQLDDRISSRIAGMTNAIRMQGKDRRI